MLGRLTGTAGIHKAAKYLAQQMHDIGLEPAGDSGYFQRVPLAIRNGRPHLLPDWATYNTLPADQRVTDVNIVGILRGSDPILRDSVILVDAHYDHLGTATPVNGDSVYNGADDDGSGTVTVLEVARILAAGPRPKRTIIFLLTTGEEVGLLGTHWYIAHPVIPLSSMTANLEIEMDGRPDSLAGGPGKAWLTGFERSTMGAMFAAAGLPIVPDPRPKQNFFRRSDNIAFAKAGIPAHTLSTFNLHHDYHRLSDEVQKIDFPHLESLIQVVARAVQLLANGPAPVWNAGGKP
jgi:Zn-dependent M28 family amino/carboxypeptidase